MGPGARVWRLRSRTVFDQTGSWFHTDRIYFLLTSARRTEAEFRATSEKTKESILEYNSSTVVEPHWHFHNNQSLPEPQPELTCWANFNGNLIWVETGNWAKTPQWAPLVAEFGTVPESRIEHGFKLFVCQWSFTAASCCAARETTLMIQNVEINI